MPDELAVLIIGALVNGLVTWGVVRTQLQWLRRDVDGLLAWREKQREGRCTPS